MIRRAARAERIEPFYVMEIAKQAAAVARASAGSRERMIYLNVGEPDFTAPPLVREAAEKAIRDGATGYTPSAGLDSLRERISGWYAERFHLNVPASRIVVTSGASAALHLACLALVNPGDEILMPDPTYPCNRQFVHLAGGRAVLIPAHAAARYQLSAAQVEQHWSEHTRGVLLASPSNPTGTSIQPDELRRIAATVAARDGITLIDEIYLGLSYDPAYGQSALALSDQIVSINSFSKYFNMTGWRLGWLVLPEELVSTVEKIAQHLYICPSTIAQHAALACFEPESLAEYERRRAVFKARRDWVVPLLNALGLTVPVLPDGAFYAWANCQSACERLFGGNGAAQAAGSWEMASELIQRARVAITPGRDFGQAETAQYVRFSTANSMARLEAAVERLTRLLG
jgi:aspartate/methionine/tyrosine aminotransferase